MILLKLSIGGLAIVVGVLVVAILGVMIVFKLEEMRK